MARTEAQSLRQYIGSAERFFFDRHACARITDLAGGTSLGGRLEELAGRSVLVATGSQLTTALALIELDGLARRLTILPPDADPEHFAAIVAGAEIDAVVVDPKLGSKRGVRSAGPRCLCRGDCGGRRGFAAPSRQTEWVMLTSGTTGVPKMVVHTLAGLTAAFRGRHGRRRRGLGYVLRHPPLWRPADFLARGARRRFAYFVQRRRADRRSSRSPWPPRRDPSVGHADALAPRADVAGDPQYFAALCPAVRRNRRPGDPRQLAQAPFRKPSSVTLMPRPKPASRSRFATASPDSPSNSSNAPATASR